MWQRQAVAILRPPVCQTKNADGGSKKHAVGEMWGSFTASKSFLPFLYAFHSKDILFMLQLHQYNQRVDEKDKRNLCYFWTKIHQIMRECRDHS